MVSNSSYATKMQYWSKHQYDPTKITDIFDGAHYRSLLGTPVTIGNEELLMWFFSDPRDVAFGFSMDGFGPFKRCNKTAWPLIIFNYNIPPKERFQKKNIIFFGTIPGPKEPADIDSFLWPIIQELLQLAIGVSAFDVIAQVSFLVSFLFYHFQLIMNCTGYFCVTCLLDCHFW
jgi:Transposase family tnp2